MPSKYDVVLVPFPFTDLSSTRLRPAVVIANPYGSDVIVAFITTQRSTRPGVADMRVAASPKNGLKRDSIIRCAKVATLDTNILVGQLGTLEKQYQKILQEKVRAVFG